MKIAVSGANGFVGRRLCGLLRDDGSDVIALVRRPAGEMLGLQICRIPDDNFASIADGRADFGRCDVFVHLAARVHLMQDHAIASIDKYRLANVDGALNAAAAALSAGAKRFIFVSSVKALGEADPGRPWREDDEPLPADPYGMSKLEAERALAAFGADHGLEVASVRPPLVYGPGVRANFRGLMRVVDRGIPLPLGCVSARRSMVYVGNLADAIRALCVQQEPVGGVYHVTDCNDLTVTSMIRAVAAALERPARLIPVPVGLLQAIGKVTGKSLQVSRLTSPLQMDTGRLRTELGWTPPWSVTEALAETARAYRSGK